MTRCQIRRIMSAFSRPRRHPAAAPAPAVVSTVLTPGPGTWLHWPRLSLPAAPGTGLSIRALGRALRPAEPGPAATPNRPIRRSWRLVATAEWVLPRYARRPFQPLDEPV